MLIVKKTVSLLLWVAYTIGMAHGAVPHSHFLGSHKAEQSAQCLIQSESDDAELMRLLIHIFSESETTDIADYFVNEASEKDFLSQSAKVAMTAVLVSFVSVYDEDVDSSNYTIAEEAGHTLLAHDQALSRRGPPVVS